MSTRKVVALVPMKGHSERVPNKNIRNFVGRPLYHRIIDSLLATPYIEKVYINTDSNFIAHDAKKNFNKVEIIDRSEELKGDFVSMNEIIAHDISIIDSQHFLQTHSTNPLLRPETINTAIEKYYENLGKYDSLFSVNRLHTRLYDRNGKPINHALDELKRTQDLPPIFEENSNIYIFSKGSFLKNSRRIGDKPFMFEMNPFEALDIDEENDFQLAELMMKLRNS